MDIKKEILSAIEDFNDSELSISSVNCLTATLTSIANQIPDGLNIAGYNYLLSTVDSLNESDRLSFTRNEVENQLNTIVQSFSQPACPHCNGTQRIQVPSPTNDGDYTEEHCFCVSEVNNG